MISDKKKLRFVDKLSSYFTTERIVITLLIIGIIIYCNALFNGFVMDDEGLILKNQSIHTFNFFRFFQGSIFDYGGSAGGVYYRPIQSVLFSTLYAIAGDHAFLYHLTQIILHITNTLLLFFLFKKFLNKHISFVLSLIFLVHPIQVEAVSYIASTQDVLFVFWGLIFLHLLPRFSHLNRWMWVPYLFLVFSILSKESGLLFLPLGLAYIFIFEKTERAIHSYISLCGIPILYVFLRFAVGGLGVHSVSEFAMMRLSFSERVIHIPALLLFYLKTFFVPVDFVAVQSWTFSAITFTNFFVPLFLVGAFFSILGFLSYRCWGKTHVYGVLLFFWIWFLLGLALHMQLTPLDVTVADRYFYFPMIGLLGILGYLFEQSLGPSLKNKLKLQQIFICCLVVILAMLSLRTIIRNADWKDTKTLALHDLQIQKDNYQLLSGLGAQYLAEKDYTAAIYYLQQSVTIYPYWGVSMYNLATSYQLSKHPKEARIYYEKSIKNAPLYVHAYENMAILLFYNFSPHEAKAYTKENLKKFPNSAKMWQVLALSELKLGNTEASSQAANIYFQLTRPH